MKKILLLWCISAQIGFSQTLQIDSLKQIWKNLQRAPVGLGTDTLRCHTLKALMKIYSDVNIDSSMHHNAQLIKFCTAWKLEKELSYAYQYAGYLYQVRGDFDQTIRYYYKALLIDEKLKQYARMARSYSGLAHAYTSLKQYAKAAQLCQQGLSVLSKQPDATIQLAILNVLGSIYREQGQLSDALNVNQEMYTLARSEHKPWFESHGLHAIGWVYKEQGQLNRALTYYKKALIFCRKIGSVDLEGSILLHIAEVYIGQHKWRLALYYCNQAKKKALQVKNSSIVAESYEDLYKIYRQTGASTNALYAYETYVRLKDSLSRVETQQRIEMLQAQYDNVRKTRALQQMKQQVQLLHEKTVNQELAQTRNGLILGILVILLVVALLFWNNNQLQAKNRELVQKNAEIKEAWFKGQTIERKRVALELHDNLSSLISAVNMSIQSINPKNWSEPEQGVYRNVKQLIQNAYAEVRNISHNILPAELEQEGLSMALSTLVGKLNESSQFEIVLTITGLQDRLPTQIEFNVYSIVFELLNNVIKHAQASSVRISLFRADWGVDLSVIDDGVGLAEHPKWGVGLQNIQTRLDSLGGTFSVVVPMEKGTWIQIKIPVEIVGFDGNTSLG